MVLTRRRLSAGQLAVTGAALFAAAMACAALDLLHIAELSAPGIVLYAGALWFIGSAVHRRWRQPWRPPWT